VTNYFYALKDLHSTLPTKTINGNYCDPKGDITVKSGCDLLNTTSTTISGATPIYDAAFQPANGWYIELDTGSTAPTEQVITTPVTVGGVTYFNTFKPTDRNSASDICSNLGKSYGYAVGFLDGGLRSGDSTRSTPYVGSGMAASPVAGVVDINGTKYPFLLGGKGASPLEPQLPKIKIVSKRKQVYRIQNIDK
jgi:type IV pilus assembly protein PilY1